MGDSGDGRPDGGIDTALASDAAEGGGMDLAALESADLAAVTVGDVGGDPRPSVAGKVVVPVAASRAGARG